MTDERRLPASSARRQLQLTGSGRSGNTEAKRFLPCFQFAEVRDKENYIIRKDQGGGWRTPHEGELSQQLALARSQLASGAVQNPLVYPVVPRDCG